MLVKIDTSDFTVKGLLHGLSVIALVIIVLIVFGKMKIHEQYPIQWGIALIFYGISGIGYFINDRIKNKDKPTRTYLSFLSYIILYLWIIIVGVGDAFGLQIEGIEYGVLLLFSFILIADFAHKKYQTF